MPVLENTLHSVGRLPAKAVVRSPWNIVVKGARGNRSIFVGDRAQGSTFFQGCTEAYV
jgi:hypothetical protein